ncbi:beta-ketoacyl synthase, partial [Endozoicomonas sp.]|nr:beta-ketoacyl synthase [Endozoicomonas sp.]
MPRLPVIVAQGGISPAGRTSGFHGYRRLVIDALCQQDKQQTLKALAALSVHGDSTSEQTLLESSLIRRLDNTLFDSNALYYHHPFELLQDSILVLKDRRLPNPLPEGWTVIKREEGQMH